MIILGPSTTQLLHRKAADHANAGPLVVVRMQDLERSIGRINYLNAAPREAKQI